ncbi:serine/threonine-protein kinase [Candidatus Uabimicrobium amorphum]|uniref:Protein kinase n=1 Tax=Uabimicrobium amorphum TaxID=2596890 RepID=A0A5S9F1A8_UABAM|nr:serine/threonine-protein kinase [Candidatus Uabimicrobium amorphum]BBM82202.1 protein kinase [Candidatus Uabimicrobium amorphum]
MKEASGRYHIKCEFARGGMGVIYEIFEKSLRRHLAMKVLSPPENVPVHKRDRDYFFEEALITAQLEHPNIVPVHDMGMLNDGHPYFTMKMVHGEPLCDIIEKLKKGDKQYIEKYPLVKRLIIFRKVCDAVAFAHSCHVIHRDIKPDNIMVGEYGEVLLMDWGIAKYTQADADTPLESRRIQSLRSKQDFSQTSYDEILGTPLYISPEQLDDDTSQVDHQSDIYLLGGTLYELLTFSPPHQGESLAQVLESSMLGRVVPPQKMNPMQQIPTELQKITMKALAHKKEHRYQKVEDLCADLDDFTAGSIVSEPVIFKEGEVLIRQDEKGTEAYFILKGKVDVIQTRADQEYLLATVEAGNIVGEMAVISEQVRMASVVAATDTQVLIINHQRMEEVLQKLPPWVGKLIFNLVDRLQTTDKNAHPLLLGDSLYHVLHQFTYILLSQMAFQIKTEEIEFNINTLTKQIAANLCMRQQKVQTALKYLATSSICQKINSETFKINDFSLFAYFLHFVHKMKKLDIAFPIPQLPEAGEETKTQALQLAQEATDYLSTKHKFTLRRKRDDVLRP